MPSNPTRPLTRHLISAVLRHGSGAGPPDRELLARFVASRDEEAFAELVRRHGSMVLAACRRVTGHSQDAEDAFQAAFLVLARRAGQITRPELLGNWLYGVAYRTGLEARAARRRAKEQQPVSDIPEPPARDSGEPDIGDLRRVIDEELARLPDKYRSAVVLCDLEGLSRKDAATRLRIPEGTLSSRLNHARKVLAVRLSRRGITTSAGAIATAFTGEVAGTTVPSQLVITTARAAARFASGGAVPPEFASTHVTTLTDGVMKAMIVNRLRLTIGVLVLGVMGIGAAATLAQFPTTPQPNDPFRGAGQEFAQPPAKTKAPEKVAAKGIEDDDVPYPSFPAQAVVRIEEGKLIVRQRGRAWAPVATELEDGRKVTAYQLATTVGGQKYDPADVSVFDMRGNRVQPKVWKEKFKTDQHVLVAFDGRVPHPRELALFKDDALLVVFPGPPVEPQTVPGYGPAYRLRRNAEGGYYYEPVGPTPPTVKPGPTINETPPAGQPVPAPGNTLPPRTVPNPTGPSMNPPGPEAVPSSN